ncbi:hypothetical protein BX600DRAFT_509337 [Xylariales sp. PMI_506]|nr:hypothetical protein BX600DRAFT_509337 [Xylariales sp. PMI_506]
MAVSFGEFVANQRKDLPIVPTPSDCTGKTYIVSGANTGLGLETARHLTRLGAARVIIAVRNLAAGETAKLDIEATTNRRGVLEVWQLDLASFASVKSFAKRAVETLDCIDALVANAGVALTDFSTTEGHESSITINVLSTFLLALLVFPKMSEDAKRLGTLPHIAIIGSEVGFEPVAKEHLHKIKGDPIRNLDDPKITPMNGRYQLSKLLQTLCVRQLAGLLPVDRHGVVINVTNPGLCKTSLSRHAPLPFKAIIGTMKFLVGRTAEMGSRTELYGAVAGKASHGCFLSACEIKESHVPDWVTNKEGQDAQRRIWEDVARELEVIEPGCIKSLF